MNRTSLLFRCSGDLLAANLDLAEAETGLLIVSGGNEVRSGAFSGQAQLAARVAQEGFAVMRFDRRGVGDSEGENRGFPSSRDDIEAAVAAFQEHAPHLRRIIGFGNCDGASALALFGSAFFDGLVLANPWTFDATESSAMPAEAIRARYASKLRNPSEIARLLRGGVDLEKLARGMLDALRPKRKPSTLFEEIQTAIASYSGSLRFLLAENDRTAQAFAAQWDARDPRINWCKGASHGFAESYARQWLAAQILDALRA